MIAAIIDDLKFYGGRSPGGVLLTILFKQAFHLVVNYRLGRFIYTHRFPGSGFFIMLLKRRQLSRYACYFSYAATIGQRLNLPHPIGIVIGENCRVADGVTLYQQCTLGQHHGGCPTIETGVVIYPGSMVVGDIHLGREATIGAQSFVNKSVPSGTKYYRKA